MDSPKRYSWSESEKQELLGWLAVLGGAALLIWALGVSLGTGIGYDNPTFGFFDGGVLATLWRLTKAVFLGVLGTATVSTAVEAVERASGARRKARRGEKTASFR